VKICIFGAGAIGGYLGAKLAQTDAEVSMIARGPHLEAMQDNGLTLIEGEGYVNVDVIASDTASFLGPQDYVFVTLKAHSVPPVVDKIAPLIGPDTTVVSAVNGVPWWYFYGLKGPHENTRLASVDPGDAQWTTFTPEKTLGCVVYPAAEVLQPGVIRHIEGNRFTLGEPSGEKSLRALALSQKLIEAGLKAPVRPKIRDEIWAKLCADLTTAPATRSAARDIIAEAQPIAETLGVKLPNAGDFAVIAPTEIDAQLSAIKELGTLLHKPTPTIDKLLASLS